MEIANTKSKFMEHINNLEKVLIHELTNIEKNNRILIVEEMTDLKKNLKEIEEDENTLQFVADHGSENQLFTLLKKRTKKHENILKMLKEIPPTSRTKIGFEEVCHEIKAIKALGFLSVHYEIIESGRSAVHFKEYEDPALSESYQKMQTTTPSEGSIHKFPLKETSQIQLDPKDFVEKNETYAKLNLQKVWITARDDNCLLVAGHVVILTEQTRVNSKSSSKNNYRVVKYIYDEKGIKLTNGLNICHDNYKECASEDYYMYSFQFPSKEIAFSCIPKSNLAVLLHDKSFNLIDTKTMEREWCLDLAHQFQAIATDEKCIYITNENCLYIYSRIGCFMKKINFINCTSFASSLNGGNFAAYCQSDQVY
ncbi:uncharacterized protein [Mytilus edulis]|uniref:uncharacterized protein n=1 Tax=Mytilus edulis TaxID=6550 RepID=UPI0039F10A41